MNLINSQTVQAGLAAQSARCNGLNSKPACTQYRTLFNSYSLTFAIFEVATQTKEDFILKMKELIWKKEVANSINQVSNPGITIANAVNEVIDLTFEVTDLINSIADLTLELCDRITEVSDPILGDADVKTVRLKEKNDREKGWLTDTSFL